MTSLKLKVQGVEDVKRNMASLAVRYGEEAAKAAVAGGQLVRGTAIKSIRNQSHGQYTTRTREGGGSYEHISSKAGEAPNTDTGRLVSSIQMEVTPRDVFVGTGLKYGKFLEFGTTRMASRPWLVPALEGNRKKINDIFRAKIRKTTAKAGKP